MRHAARLLLVSVLSCAASGAAAADAAENYPNKPIRVIVTFVAGGPSDVIARVLGQKLTEKWGQTIIVDNRGSAGGLVGMELAARAAPDGYTLLVSSGSNLTINPSVYRKLPYDPVRDFEPVTQVSSGPYYMVVPPSLPAKTVAEFVALAKAKAGQLNYASTGTNNLLGAEQFNYMAGIKTVGVSYKGTGQAVTAVMSGEVQSFIASPLVVVPLIKGGKLRAIGITGLKRSTVLPDVPAIAETLPGYENITWHSVMAPAKTPKPILAKLANELIRIIKQPDVAERFTSQGLDAVGSTPEELAVLIKKEIKMYADLCKQIGLEPQ